MKKIFFIFSLIFMILPLPSFANKLTHIKEGQFINVSFIEPNCSNSCLNNFSDIEKCNAGKIILEDIQQFDVKNR